MNYRIRPDGAVEVPKRAEHQDGTVGDGIEVIEPGEPGYEDALAAAKHDQELERGIE